MKIGTFSYFGPGHKSEVKKCQSCFPLTLGRSRVEEKSQAIANVWMQIRSLLPVILMSQNCSEVTQ